ncbi:hypothetical protein [Nocardia sp. CA-290969]|uniref:hypothetical protein n=1 Tax=Nocardia sp. CA-290969 TaxID=3239986 RepID=UPI003D8F36C7
MSLLAEKGAGHFAFALISALPPAPRTRLLRQAADDLTTPAAVERWNEWSPIHQFMAEHGAKGTSDV